MSRATPHAAVAAPDPAAARRWAWLMIFAGTVFGILSGIDLASELYFSVRGEREAGTVISTEGGIGRVATVVAQVQVSPRAGAPFPVEIRDTFGKQGWKEGSRVDLLCARIHADHTNCVPDVWSIRYPLTLIAFAIAIGLLWLGIGARVRMSREAATVLTAR